MSLWRNTALRKINGGSSECWNRTLLLTTRQMIMITVEVKHATWIDLNITKEKCSHLRNHKHFLKPQLEICIKTHSEALIILQTSKLKVSDFFKKITKLLYTFLLFLAKELLKFILLLLFIFKVPCHDAKLLYFAFSFATTYIDFFFWFLLAYD